MADFPKPELMISLENGQTIKMTYGLLMDIQRLLPGPDTTIELLLSDTYTQDYVVRRVMTPHKGMVDKMEDLVTSEELDLTPDDVQNILQWVVQHNLSFFAKRSLALAAEGENFQKALPNLSLTGSAS